MKGNNAVIVMNGNSTASAMNAPLEKYIIHWMIGKQKQNKKNWMTDEQTNRYEESLTDWQANNKTGQQTDNREERVIGW